MTELIHSVIGVPARPPTAWQHLAGPGPVVRCGYQSAAEELQPSAAAYGDSPKPGQQPMKLRIQSQSEFHPHYCCMLSESADVDAGQTSPHCGWAEQWYLGFKKIYSEPQNMKEKIDDIHIYFEKLTF